VGVECMFTDGSSGWIRRGQEPAGFASRALKTFVDLHGDSFAGARHREVRKESSGYAAARFADSGDLVDLLVGSEGTLAIFTTVELRLTTLPGAVAGVMGVFAS